MSLFRRGSLAVVLLCVSVQLATAQAAVPQIRGDYALGSGTLLPPGAYLSLFYNYYGADRVNDSDGIIVPALRPRTQLAQLVGNYTFPSRILYGHWSVMARLPFQNAARDVADARQETGWGFGDMFVQPVKLGWSVPAADLVAGFGVYMPTGRFSVNSLDNTGLGMWSYEWQAGSTVYLSPSRTSTASMLISFQASSDQRDTDRRPGNLLTLEGGVGHNFVKNAGQFGLAYYAQWKVSDDRNYPLPPTFDSRDHMFGIGPEVTYALPVQHYSGLATLQYYMEFGNRVAPQGQSLFLTFTVSKPAKKP